MTDFSLGIFVDAHHLLEVEDRSRRAFWVLDQIENAAQRLCMASGVSHRVAVADCADARARQVAEDFADHGFRIRHVPQRAGFDRASILGAEVLDATSGRAQLLTVAVVGEPAAYLPLTDSLHRSGRALIACSAGAPAAMGQIDGLISIPLSGAKFRELIRDGLRLLAARQVTETSLPQLESTLRSIQPGFTAAAYGVQTKKVLTLMKEPGVTFRAPDRIEIDPAVLTGDSNPRPAADPPANAMLHRMIVETCYAMPAHQGTVTMDSATTVLHAMLDKLTAVPVIRALAVEAGLPLSTLGNGLRHLIPYHEAELKLGDLCEKGSAGTDWSVWRNPDKAADVRLLLGASVPQPDSSSDGDG